MTVIASPCNNICRMHQPTGWCEGCARTIDEIVAWGRADDDFKRHTLAQLPPRRERLAELGIFIIADQGSTP